MTLAHILPTRYTPYLNARLSSST